MTACGYCCYLEHCSETNHIAIKGVIQEGGGVSKVNIGSVTTASVTSRFTWTKFKMAPNW